MPGGVDIVQVSIGYSRVIEFQRPVRANKSKICTCNLCIY